MGLILEVLVWTHELKALLSEKFEEQWYPRNSKNTYCPDLSF